uniref:Putative ovule protein n=1 Tax=Solanum chacoense TaxID=4108 RepID=A0A0V0HVR7_SOLCH
MTESSKTTHWNSLKLSAFTQPQTQTNKIRLRFAFSQTKPKAFKKPSLLQSSACLMRQKRILSPPLLTDPSELPRQDTVFFPAQWKMCLIHLPKKTNSFKSS